MEARCPRSGPCAGGWFGEESKWRQNIPDLGIGDGFIQLCARLLFPANWYICKEVRGGVTYAFLISVPGTNRPYDFVSGWPITPANPHFPYGLTVEPD